MYRRKFDSFFEFGSLFSKNPAKYPKMLKWHEISEFKKDQQVEVAPISPSKSKHQGKTGIVKKKDMRRITVIFDDGSTGLVDFSFLKIVCKNDKDKKTKAIITKIKNKIYNLLEELEIK